MRQMKKIRRNFVTTVIVGALACLSIAHGQEGGDPTKDFDFMDGEWSTSVEAALPDGSWRKAEGAGPQYASTETRTAVERMIETHGGLERWRQAPSVSFRRTATFTNNPSKPWVLEEHIEQGRRRLYQDWPVAGSRLASNGGEVWTVDWSVPFPPRFVAQIGFYFLNMPWITQDPGVVLGQLGRGKYPGAGRELLTVPVSFEPGTGETPDDRYVLYIDPESFRLEAVEYHVSYGALLDASFLPPDQRTMGPFFHVNHEFESIDGFLVPVAYGVYYGPAGAKAIDGAVEVWSFARPFDETKLVKPDEAVVDASSPIRKINQ